MHRRFIGPIKTELPRPKPSYLGRYTSDVTGIMKEVMREHNLPEDLIHKLVGINGEIMDEEPRSIQRSYAEHLESHPLDAIDQRYQWQEMEEQDDNRRDMYIRRLPYRQYEDFFVDPPMERVSESTLFQGGITPVSRRLPILNRRVVRSKRPIPMTQEELRAVRARYYR